MIRAAVLATVLLTASGHGLEFVHAQARDAAPPPRLLVMLVVDQMRFDYIEQYGQRWTGGLKRLVREGAVFDRGFYPYLNTVTCAGHATIGTGTLPYRHGVILNEWYQRAAGRRMACTADPSVTSVPYDGPAEPTGHSAHRLRAASLADRLRATSPQSRVVVLSMKPRSAVMLAGHGGTAVTWFADSNVWATSTAYASTPVREVQAFVETHPVERQRADVWTRLRDARDYRHSADGRFERPRTGWTSEFPHPLAGAPGTPREQFFDLWERSPFSDAYLGQLAMALTQTYQLGRREAVDYLAISFSALDYVGHDFGPRSEEVQDTLYRLDQTIGELLALLDHVVGPDRYAVGLSSDHGVSDIPEALHAAGTSAGRVLNAEVQKVAEAAMTAAYGPGPHVAHVEYTNVYLTETAKQRLSADREFVRPIISAVTQMAGIQRVFVASELPALRHSADPIARAAALSYHPDESGELIVVLQPHWIGTNTSAATHGSAQWYDQHVPVIFLGPAFTPGRYSTPASPADLSPTLASLIDLPMPDVDGTIRREALR